jgi:membrane-associated protease RseP (regulator of RpoE activity)
MDGWLSFILIVAVTSFFYVIRIVGEFIAARRLGVGIELVSIGWGPTLFKLRIRSTDYRLALIPFQSYVKFAGELGDSSPPDGLWNRRWIPLVIFAAPILATLLATLAICIAAHWIGPIRMSPYVGSLDFSEVDAGMRRGDRIVSVGGVKVECLEDYRMAMLRYDFGAVVPVEVERDGWITSLQVTARGSQAHAVRPNANMIYVKRGPLTDLAPGDELIAATWKDSRHTILGKSDYVTILRDSAGQTLTFTVRKQGRIREITVDLPVKFIHRFPHDDDLLEPIIGQVVKGSPAERAGLEPGDRILQFNHIKIQTWKDIRNHVGFLPGEAARLVINRRGTKLDREVKISSAGKIGITVHRSPVLARVAEDSFWFTRGLRSGDRLIRVGSTQGDLSPEDLFSEEGASTVSVVVERDGQSLNLQLSPDPLRVADESGLGIEFGPSAVRISLPLGCV